jgi:hypothetical protein
VELIYGARSTMNVWQPVVEYKNEDRPEFSMGLLFVSAGVPPGFEYVEVGWQVSHPLLVAGGTDYQKSFLSLVALKSKRDACTATFNYSASLLTKLQTSA